MTFFCGFCSNGLGFYDGWGGVMLSWQLDIPVDVRGVFAVFASVEWPCVAAFCSFYVSLRKGAWGAHYVLRLS